jgi:hypothetical protein
MQVSLIPPHTFQSFVPYVLFGSLFFSPLGSTILILLLGIFYILTLRNALLKCSPESRTMDPGKLWLLLIPIFNLGWHFVVVLNMSASLRTEFALTGIRSKDREPGKMLGLAMCILMVCPFPIFMILLMPAGLVCWIVYWVKISGYSRALGELHETLSAPVR